MRDDGPRTQSSRRPPLLVALLLLSPFLFVGEEYVRSIYENSNYCQEIGILSHEEALRRIDSMKGLTPLDALNIAQARQNEVCAKEGTPEWRLPNERFFITKRGEYFFPVSWGKWHRIGPIVCDRGGFYVNPTSRTVDYINPFTPDYQRMPHIPWSNGVRFDELPPR